MGPVGAGDQASGERFAEIESGRRVWATNACPPPVHAFPFPNTRQHDAPRRGSLALSRSITFGLDYSKGRPRREAHVCGAVYRRSFSLPLASAAMELITILNRCHRFRGFVYQQARFSADHKSIEISVRARKGSVALCSRCHELAPGDDQLAERRWCSIAELQIGISKRSRCQIAVVTGR